MEHIKSYLNNLVNNSSLITISIVTYLGYLLAYLFELESAKFYNIPEYLVQIEFLPVLIIAVIIYLLLVLIGFTIFQLAYLIKDLFPFLQKLKIFYPEKDKRRKFELWFLVAMGLILLTLLAPRIIAQLNAEKSKFFVTVRKDNKEYAIVKIYGDSAIALAVATKSGALTRDVYIFPKAKKLLGL